MVPLFTKPDIWLGGFYELAIELGPRSDERLLLALNALWKVDGLELGYERQDIEPFDQERIAPSLDHLHLHGTLRLPDRRITCCGVVAIREDEGPDWLVLYIPMGALEGLFDVGSFPFRDTDNGWHVSIDEFFVRIANELFSAVNFPLALVGHEVSGFAYAEEVAAKGVPARRGLGYLVQQGNALSWYPPTGI